MNILPKKRWHVRTKDNIARVRRDEAQAADEEREKLRRAKLAEQEARTALLRQKARSSRPGSDGPRADEDDVVTEKISSWDNHQVGLDDERPQGKDSAKKSVDAFSRVQKTSATTADIYTKEGNINFFKDLESGGQGTTGSLTNKDHEAEERAEKEKYEKQIGLLTYLGQDSLEASKSKAWYNDDKCVSAIWSKAAKRESAAEEEEKEDKKADDNLEVGLKYKKSQDPLNDVIKYTGWKPIKSCPALEKDTSSFTSNHGSLGLSSSSRDYPVFAISDGKCNRKMKKMLKKKKKRDKNIRDHGTRFKRSSKKSEKDKIETQNDDRSDDSQLRRRDKRKKSRNIKSSGKKIRESDGSYTRKESRSSSCRRHGSSSSDSDEQPSSKRQRNKHRSKSSKRSRSSSSQSSDSSYTTDSEAELRDKEEKRGQLERLRAERLTREAAERKRAQRLLAGLDPNIEPPPPLVPGAARQKYSAQFNPLVARQNKEPLKAGVKYF